jgi:hypothetical protein
MIRTLRITSIITIVAAVMLLILPMVYGVHSDPAIAELLKAPDAVEKFKETKGQVRSNNEGQVSPLVKQAIDYSTYLNPPPPATPPPPPSTTGIQEAEPMSPVTAKFDLRGTSYYPGHPELSLALIDEPGKGLNWVRQGSTVGRLVIEEIKDGVIVVRDGQSKSEMKVDIKEAWRELLKNPAAGLRTNPAAGGVGAIQAAKTGPATPGQVNIREARTGSAATPASRSPIRPTSRRIRPGTEKGTVTTNPQMSQPAMSQEIANNPEEQQTGAHGPGEEVSISPPPIPTEKDIIHNRLMEEVRQSRMTEEEAKEIEGNIQTLEQLDDIQRQRAEDR